MPKKLPFTKEDYFKLLDQKLILKNPVVDKLKLATEKLKSRLGGTTLP